MIEKHIKPPNVLITESLMNICKANLYKFLPCDIIINGTGEYNPKVTTIRKKIGVLKWIIDRF
jgi:hypothetical protein